jgi:hypothetical protein
MTNPFEITVRYFKVMISGQAYLNLIYLLAAFPLGVFYFVFLVSGLSIGISLSIVWVGIPLLLVVGVGWWILARFEHFMAVHWLKEEVPSMVSPQSTVPPAAGHKNIWEYFKGYFSNPVTWKSPVYLLLKFPLGIATFVILVTLVSLSLAFLTLPLTYELLDFQIGGFLSPDNPVWQVDNISEALFGMLIGLFLGPLTMQVANGLAWVHAKFARVMLSVDPVG